MRGGGMANMTSTNLSGIMKTMKFALHSSTKKDFQDLQDLVSNLNFTYTIKTNNVCYQCSISQIVILY